MPGIDLTAAKPLVSVIIPVYNVAPYLRRCLDSVCKQSYPNLEIILVDNNSTDQSAEICQEYETKDVRIKLEHQSVQGLGATRDRGIDVATGEWICFVDSDDYVHPQYVELLLRAVTENNCLTCQCRCRRVAEREEAMINGGSGEIRMMDFRRYFVYLFQHAAEGYTPFGACNNIYHQSLFNKVRFGAYRFAEDSGFTPQIIYAAREQQVAVLDKILYYYAQRDDSLLHSLPDIKRVDRYYTKKIGMDLWKAAGEEELYHLFFNDFYSCVLRDYLDLLLYLPEERQSYEFLRDEIHRYYPEAIEHSNGYLVCRPGSKQLWENLSESGSSYIQYGYGNVGKSIYRRLTNLAVRIDEIWDAAAIPGMRAPGGVTVIHPRWDMQGSPTLLIAIADEFVGMYVRMNFHGTGYRFVPILQLEAALRYAEYQKYLPFLLDGYRC